ncbi:MAG: vanadium-dependent haloperoxidase [Planctomycetia bacterium]|jgi:hypothetical protein
MTTRVLVVVLLFSTVVAGMAPRPARAGDLVTDWNATLRSVIQLDGTSPAPLANPGWSTRSMAMTNGAIYDIYQARNRTHQPFLYSGTITSDVTRDAAVNQAAYRLLTTLYNGSTSGSAATQAAYTARMGTIANGAEKTAGVALGDAVANAYISARAADLAHTTGSYAVNPAAGHWSPDPFHSPQTPWGPTWGQVTPFAIASKTAIRTLPSLEVPALSGTTNDLAAILASPTYATYFNEVKSLGAIDSTTRTADQTEIGVFWGYDRPTLGPPPVLYNQALGEIVDQVGTNTAEQNARLFAMASVAMADAAITAWDAKFYYDFWRPVTAIQRGAEDGNPGTDGDVAWRPLGAPGVPDTTGTSDFTPPFPAWPSGHATMGAALFRTVENFYGTNSFAAITGSTATYQLSSDELLPGIWDTGTTPGDIVRAFSSFTTHIDGTTPDWASPEWENAISRIYLGIHWRFDATDGIRMGTAIADEVAVTTFQAVPEPGVILPAVGGLAFLGWLRRRRSGPTADRPEPRAGRGWRGARSRSR